MKFDFKLYIEMQSIWSYRTFGPGPSDKGIIDHIRKELVEIEDAPGDLEEWIDVIILAIDGAIKRGYAPDEIIRTLLEKQTKNMHREWPDWRSAKPGKAIEHIKK